MGISHSAKARRSPQEYRRAPPSNFHRQMYKGQERDTMSLRAMLDALSSTHNEASDPTGSALRAAVVKLIDEEERVRPLKVGDEAPRFELRSYDDVSVASDNLLKSGPLVLTFYRGL